MIALRGALRIDPKPDTGPAQAPVPVFFQLGKGIEDHMIADRDNLVHLLLPVAGRKYMILLSHLFPAKSCLVKAAGRCPRQVLSDQRVFIKHGKSFLSQQNPAAGVAAHFPEDLKILS